MEILTLKLDGYGGYIVNGIIAIPEGCTRFNDEIAGWIKEGNTPEPADALPIQKPQVELPIPEDVDKLDLVGLREVVKLLIERVGG